MADVCLAVDAAGREQHGETVRTVGRFPVSAGWALACLSCTLRRLHTLWKTRIPAVRAADPTNEALAAAVFVHPRFSGALRC